MSLLDRINRVVKTKLNNIVSKAEDSEKILELVILYMEEDLVELRQEVAQLIATQKRTQQQYNQAVTEKNNWLVRSQLALSKGDENLAEEALRWRKPQFDYIDTIKATLEQQTAQVEYLKRRLIVFESNLSEAKTKRELLKSKIAKEKAQKQLENPVYRLGTSSSVDTKKADVCYSDFNPGFPMLEPGSDVDEELLAMKEQLTGSSPNQTTTNSNNPATSSSSTLSNSSVDKDLEELKRLMDEL